MKNTLDHLAMGSQTAKYYEPGGSKHELRKKKFRSQERE